MKKLNEGCFLKILLLDIENSPNLGWVWGKWQQDVIEFDKDWYILCWCAKWLGKKEIMSSALIDYDGYKRNKENDFYVIKELWKLLDEADVVIAHNGIAFDRKKANSRFLSHGLTPPSPYKMIDTLLVARSEFSFTSNKLNDLGRLLQVGRKVATGGFKLWKGCMNGDRASWDKMVKYCKQDVRLLERVYKKVLPYIKSHPNHTVYNPGSNIRCVKCGSSRLIKRGFSYTSVSCFQKYVCRSCGGWSRSKISEKREAVILKNAI